MKKIASYLDQLAPPTLALEGDNVGLQVGDPETTPAVILVALEINEQVLEEAVAGNAELVITHHPLVYRPLRLIDQRRHPGNLIAKIIQNKISVYSAHTNLDVVPGGVNSVLAELIGIKPDGREVIEASGADPLLKLVVFVPSGYEEALLQALAEAGAGWIGNYSHCTFQAPGVGTFMPRADTNPFIGELGRLEKVNELRLETIMPASLSERVIAAMQAAHPYEEVAYDLYELARPGRTLGLGLLGQLDSFLTLEELIKRCSERLAIRELCYWAPAGRTKYSRVAVCGGSGGRLVEPAASKGAEVYISGDFSYHDLQCAAGYGLATIDAGHFYTERPVVARLADYLKGRLAAGGYRTTVLTAASGPTAKWNFFQG